MKLPERNERYLISTMTLIGSILLVVDIWGGLSSWWALLYVPLFFMGHSQEYKEMFLWPKKSQ